MKSRRNLLVFKSYFQLRFGGRHLESEVKNVWRRRRRHIVVGHGRKCGGSRWNYVCILLETEVTSTSRKSSIFPWRCPWFSTSLQVLERTIFTRKTPKHPELDPLGTGFDRILKFARVANIFEKHRGCKFAPPPPAVRGLKVQF